MNDQARTGGSDDKSASSRVEPEPRTAIAHRSLWPGWIWAIPIAALLIVGWLAFKQIVGAGPEVTIEFATASGIQPGSTSVEYQGLKVGQVDSVHLEKDLEHFKVTAQMDAAMKGHLGKGTLFWIANAHPSLTNLASLRSIISGPTIQILPELGPKQKLYYGFSRRPAVLEGVPGRHYILHADRLGHLSRSSPVYFGGYDVGNVESTTLEPDQRFIITIFIRAPYDKFVHTGTRFWNAGAVNLALQPNGPQLQLGPIAALVQGAVDFETPFGLGKEAEAPDNQQFTLYDSKDAATYAPSPQAVTYRVAFPAVAGGLDTGAGVDLAGKRIGTVTESGLEYDSTSGTLITRATIALEPDQIGLTGGARWSDNPRQQMNAIMAKLISQGLRAQLGSAVPMVGPSEVKLIFAQGETQLGLIPGTPPEIPAVNGGSGINGIMTAMNRVVGKLGALPLDQIANNVREITGRLAALSRSPQLTASLDRLNQSIANVEHLTATASAEVPELVTELRRVASQASATVAQARAVLNNQSGVTTTGVQTAGLQQTLYELSQAARAVRQLADMIDRNPTVLIRGKG
jgi:paraquat-inducible protein B